MGFQFIFYPSNILIKYGLIKFQILFRIRKWNLIFKEKITL